METAKATDKHLQFIVVTPEKALLDEPADFVALPMVDGELGVLPGRAPLIGQLGFGEMRMTMGTTTRRLYADGGFAQVRDNVVTVLTPRAIPAEEIKLEDARNALQAAQAAPATPETQDEKIKAQQRARAQVRMAQKMAET
ncbi:MAG: ATP synthase F1 subunit epsilon [Planctomycetes bacterium]|nr:ATP synthase F1 subunit epsilon [Planctomycetota bacterium]